MSSAFITFLIVFLVSNNHKGNAKICHFFSMFRLPLCIYHALSLFYFWSSVTAVLGKVEGFFSLSAGLGYLVLPPATPGGTQRCQLSFQAVFTNNESRSVQIIKLRVRFEAASGVPHRDIMIKTLGADGKLVIDGLRLQPGETLAPMDFKNTDNILIEGTPPAQVLFEVHARDFDQPKNYTFDLARYEVPAGGYDWPGRAGDLARGEYWEGIGAEHCCGPQLYAHDLGVVFFDPVKLDWSPFHHMKDGNRNDEYRVWGKPVYAMADGTVHALNAAEVDDNPHPPTVPDNVQTFGNHFIIDHAGELMLYAHLQFGTRNMTLVNRGVGGAVQRGDFLGLVGNSGNSHGPHLHVHCSLPNVLVGRDAVVRTMADGGRELIINAPNREELEAASRALDRVLSWNYFLSPGWDFNAMRTARWDRYSRPDVMPAYAYGFPTIWWAKP